MRSGSSTPGREQAVLLINRRGAATFILCRDCGESLRCPDCDLPFVFHLDGGSLRCHHCGRRAAVTERCPSCGSARIRYFGAGTQRVESELRTRFPRPARGAPGFGRPQRPTRLRDDLRRLPGRTDRRPGRDAAGGQGPRSAHRHAGGGDRRRRHPQPAGLSGGRAHLPAPRPGGRPRRAWTPSRARHLPDVRTRPLRGAQRRGARRRRLRRRRAASAATPRISAVRRARATAHLGRRPRPGRRAWACGRRGGGGARGRGPWAAAGLRRATCRSGTACRSCSARPTPRRAWLRSSCVPPGIAIDVDPESLL